MFGECVTDKGGMAALSCDESRAACSDRGRSPCPCQPVDCAVTCTFQHVPGLSLHSLILAGAVSRNVPNFATKTDRGMKPGQDAKASLRRSSTAITTRIITADTDLKR